MPDILYATERPRLVQQAFQYDLQVLPNQPTRLSTTLDDTQYITEFWITNPTTVPPATANSVWIGWGPNVTSTAGTVLGIEVPPGKTEKFKRRLYDTSFLLPTDPMAARNWRLVQTPVVIWDLTQLWGISGPDPISVNIVITAFPQVYL